MGGRDEGRGPRIERVRASLRAAKFTGKGDDKVVVGLYNDYIVDTNAMNASEVVEGDGEYNTAGERRAMARCGADVYEGQWKGGKPERIVTRHRLRGSTRRVSGTISVCRRRRLRGRVQGR